MIPMKPADATWTDEQWQAIYEEGKNIIVSAGAGSGKTAVLTERVIRKLKSGILVNQLLILTFTKAAASEMKDRIRKKIKKDESLKHNLNLLESSYITTFDSFALSVVMKYHYLLNLSPNIGIIDPNIIRIQKDKVMDEIFLEYYEKGDSNFLKMIDSFCTKDDTDLRNYLLNISNQLDLLSNKEEYLQHYLSTFFDDKKLDKDIILYTNLIRDKIKLIHDKVTEISYLDSDFSIKLSDSLEVLNDFDGYDDLVQRLNIKLPMAPRGSEEELKNKKKEISECLKEIKQLAHFKDSNEIRDSIMKTYPTIQIMIELILEFTKRIWQYKEKNNSYEFNDIAILAIKIVKDYSEARDELSSYFQEIMIDEYQDTNDLQEEFIGMISHNNTYMVGDIKQSIYRFRNANPYIFKNKYDTYSHSNTDLKIDLNKNFRSRSEVLDNINIIFNLVMNDTIGGANYLESHQMIFGNGSYLKENVSHSNDMEIYQYEYDKAIGFTKEEVEAFMIASDIKKKVESDYQIFDKDTGVLRSARYDDFAIIMDRASAFDLYKKIFNYFSIPVALLKDEKMNEETDILVISNLIRFLFKVRDNAIDTEFRYLFTSILRSFLYQVSDDQIFQYFEHHNYWDSELYCKCKKISENLSYMTSHELIDVLLEEFHYYARYITIGNIQSGIVKVDKLKEMAMNLEQLGYTILDFSNYLVDLLKRGYSIEYKVPDTGSDAVKIMTIHKSKGLEYPVCYFSGLYKEFNISDLKDRFLYHKDIGIIVPYFDEGIDQTIYKDILRNNYIEEEISEKIRLFYVALTRAREKMILITPMTGKENDSSRVSVLEDAVKLRYRSFSDILDSIMFRIKPKYVIKRVNDLLLSHEYHFTQSLDYKTRITNTDTIFEVREIQIEDQEREVKHFSKQTKELFTQESMKMMKYGTLVHEYLEYLDFKNPDLEMIDDLFCRKKIGAFLKQDVLRDVLNAHVYQEYEFIKEDMDTTYHGIIDLMLEYSDHIDIIDYKLSDIHDKAYLEQLDGYYDYIHQITDKEIHLYLYSFIQEKFLKIK